MTARWFQVLSIWLLSALAVVGALTLSGTQSPVGANGALPASFTGTKWHTETVDVDGYQDTSLAFDDNGYPHIAYVAVGDNLNYAHWTGSDWETGYVDDLLLGGRPSLALDPSGHPHVSYSACNPYICEARYARWTGVEWQLEGAHVAGSIATDARGNPHIAGIHGNVVGQTSVVHTYYSGTQWISDTVESSGTFRSVALTLDGSGNPHISYRDDTKVDVKYARWTGSDWDIKVVDSAGDVGKYFTAIALDAVGNPHLSYRDDRNDALKHARWTGSDWSVQVVTEAGSVIFPISIAVDTNGYPHITYSGRTDQTIGYARWTGSAWEVGQVGSGWGDGWYWTAPINLTSVFLQTKGCNTLLARCSNRSACTCRSCCATLQVARLRVDQRTAIVNPTTRCRRLMVRWR